MSLSAVNFSELEIRVLSNLDPKSVDEYLARGGDAHALRAAAHFGIPLNDVTPTQRRFGKSLNYLGLYCNQDPIKV